MKLALNTALIISVMFLDKTLSYSLLEYLSVKQSKGQQPLLTVSAWRLNVLAVFSAGTMPTDSSDGSPTKLHLSTFGKAVEASIRPTLSAVRD